MLLALLSRFARFAQAFAAHRHHLIESISRPYRPELHYMRGPGPKWRARHGSAR